MDGGRIRHRMWRPCLWRPCLWRPCLWPLGRLGSACLIAAGLSLFGVAVGTGQAAASVPGLSHVFVIVEENNGYHDVIDNPAAPNLNYLAKTFGVETDYFGVSPDSSESNYVGLLGGSTFGVTSDDAYWKNRINAPSLISQLDQDASPANHYSLLSTIQHTFGLGCLQFTCDTKHVKPLTSMFAVTGSKAIATEPLPERTWPTPTPGDPRRTHVTN